MTVYDPPSAPRQRESGSKGDGWIVTLPPVDARDPVLGLDTGLDGVAILRIPSARWDHGDQPLVVHAHADHDETIVIPAGSGAVYQGTDPAALTPVPFQGPVVLFAPAGVYHHVVMDPDSSSPGTCFFTVPGSGLPRFAEREPLNRFGKVTFADLRVVSPPVVTAQPWTGAAVLDRTIRGRIAEGGPASGGDGQPLRVIGYDQPADGYVLPLDTGRDSIFVMISRGRSWGREPAVVDVHSHVDVDEFIVIESGEGYLLNGPDLESVTLTPFRGPAVIVMPSGAFHRIVRTDDEVVDSVLIYTDRRAVVPLYPRIMERTTFVAVDEAAREEVTT